MEEDFKKLPLIENEDGDLDTTKLNMIITVVNHLAMITQQLDNVLPLLLLNGKSVQSLLDKENELSDKIDSIDNRLYEIDEKLFNINSNGVKLK
jgi:hypothetical protein